LIFQNNKYTDPKKAVISNKTSTNYIKISPKIENRFLSNRLYMTI